MSTAGTQNVLVMEDAGLEARDWSSVHFYCQPTSCHRKPHALPLKHFCCTIRCHDDGSDAHGEQESLSPELICHVSFQRLLRMCRSEGNRETIFLSEFEINLTGSTVLPTHVQLVATRWPRGWRQPIAIAQRPLHRRWRHKGIPVTFLVGRCLMFICISRLVDQWNGQNADRTSWRRFSSFWEGWKTFLKFSVSSTQTHPQVKRRKEARIKEFTVFHIVSTSLSTLAW